MTATATETAAPQQTGGADWVIVCVYMPFWWAPGHPYQPDVTGQMLAAYDPDALAGWEWTTDPERAMRFVSGVAALECWKQVSRRQPRRLPDGKPNRPLTAFSVTIERAP